MERVQKPRPIRSYTVKPSPYLGLGGKRTFESLAKEDAARELLKALNSTAQSARKSWLVFITLMAYLFVATASVTHIDLLLNTPVKLPLLQIEVALYSFFLVAPALFILVHFGVLLHHAMLARKAGALTSFLRKQEDVEKRIHPLRMEVSSYFFAQNMVGPELNNALRFLLRAMSFLTLILIPLCLLLYFQLAFLPAHDELMTTVHRLYVFMDICVLLFIGSALHSPGLDAPINPFQIVRTHPRHFIVVLSTASLILFSSICIATLPSREDFEGINLDRLMTSLWPTKVPFDWNNQICREWRGDRCAFWLAASLLEQRIDYVSGRSGLFSRNLVVTDRQVLLQKQAARGDVPRISLRGRDLRYATFDRSDLRNVDFTAADLSGASLKSTDLRNAVFGCAIKGKKTIVRNLFEDKKQFSSIDDEECANLTASDLSGAILTNGSINRAIVKLIFYSTNLQVIERAA